VIEKGVCDDCSSDEIIDFYDVFVFNCQ